MLNYFIKKLTHKKQIFFKAITIALIFFVTFYLLWPLLSSGYVSDDSYNSQIIGTLIQNKETLYHHVFSEIGTWLKYSGRFLLGWLYIHPIYYYVNNITYIKIINILVITLGNFFFFLFTKNQTKSNKLALLSSLVITCFFQIRAWHDPIIAFTFLIPTIFLLSISSIYFFTEDLKSPSYFKYYLAIFLYSIAVFFYEIAYIFCWIFLLLAFERFKSFRASMKKSFPFFMPVFIALFFSFSIRIFSKHFDFSRMTYPGVSINLEPIFFLKSFFIQIVASLPLSYFYFSQHEPLSLMSNYDYIFFGSFFLLVSALIFFTSKEFARFKLKYWMLSGLILIFLPAIIVAFSGHQKELIDVGFGFGYIPVYIQYFGLCILLMSLMFFCLPKRSNFFAAFLSIIFSALITYISVQNFLLNRSVILKSNQFYLYPRNLLNSALDAGLLNEISSDDYLLRTMRFPSDHPWFFSSILKKQIFVCDIGKSVFSRCNTKIPPKFHFKVHSSNNIFDEMVFEKDNVFVLSYQYEPSGLKKGQVILGHIKSIFMSPISGEILNINVGRIKVYDFGTESIVSYDFKGNDINFVDILNDQVLSFQNTYNFYNLKSINSPISFEWIGTHGKDGDSNHNVRWSPKSSSLIVFNSSPDSKRVNVSMSVSTPTKSNSLFTLSYGKKNEKFNIGLNPLEYNKNFLIHPGQFEIKLNSDAPRLLNGDPRNIVFGVYNFNLNELD